MNCPTRLSAASSRWRNVMAGGRLFPRSSMPDSFGHPHYEVDSRSLIGVHITPRPRGSTQRAKSASRQIIATCEKRGGSTAEPPAQTNVCEEPLTHELKEGQHAACATTYPCGSAAAVDLDPGGAGVRDLQGEQVMNALGRERVVGEITVDGVALAPELGIEIPPGSRRAVWLTCAGKRWRLPASQIVVVRPEGSTTTMRVGSDGKGVYRREPRPAA